MSIAVLASARIAVPLLARCGSLRAWAPQWMAASLFLISVLEVALRTALHHSACARAGLVAPSLQMWRGPLVVPLPA
eukprot:10749403-Alexandrium_andersonii.AAC.1